MSLFKAREWWSTLSGYEEFHTTGSLLVTTVTSQYDNSTQNAIVVGSFSGILRVYVPSNGTFSPDHLLLEKQLQSPIIKLGVAKFTSDPMLVILHMQEVVIYSFSFKEDQLSLLPINQYSLNHMSHDMIIGGFGRVNNDLICVQSLDGLLQVFDHNSQLLTYQLSDVILPGPLTYISTTDTILTVTTARYIEGYLYQSLSKGSHKTGAKKSKCDWSLQLGDPVIDIKSITAEGCPSVILVLGERNLFCLKDSTVLLFSIKLESNPTCVLPYKLTVTDDGSLTCMYMLAGYSQQLQIFSNQVMVWSAQLSHVPVALSVGQFDGLDGIIVTLDELGHLQCSYLGTDPISFTHSLTSNTTTSVQELEEELRQLQSAIEESDKKGLSISTDSTMEITSVTYSEPRPLESEDEENIEQLCVEAKVILHCSDPLIFDINVNIDVAPPISVHPVTLLFDSSDKEIDKELVLTFVCSSTQWASVHKAYLVVTYSTNMGRSYTIDHTLSLPLGLFCKPTGPQDGQHKVTLDSSHKCVPLTVLYSNNEGEGQSNAIGFQLLTGQCVTMITSKTSNRYRLQSDSFPALSAFVEDLVLKLQEHHKKDNQFRLSFSSTLPLTEYFECIEQHYKVRVGLQQCSELLSRHAHQFRAIQKRLLARFKDKTPAGLVNLDALLDGTFMQLMALTEKCEELQSEEDHTMRLLTSASQLLIALLQLSVHLPPQDVLVLQGVLTPNISPNADQGWEEVVDVGVTQLLKTTLAKASKDFSVSLPELELPLDCKRLKRHIALMCDRINKGGRLTGTQSLTDQPHLPTLIEQ